MESEVQIGNEINNIELVRWTLRTQFDRNLVTLYDVQEQIYDYIFAHLGINTEGKVDHPIVLTEPVCNPNYCRQQMSELLFECYHVPQVAYGIDAMFSLYANQAYTENSDSLIVSCGYQTTHILPVLNGRIDSMNCRRINLGGATLDGFMQRLLQLKYPGHSAAVTISRAEELVRDHCHVAIDYKTELEDWTSNDYYEENVHKIQLPYTNISIQPISLNMQINIQPISLNMQINIQPISLNIQINIQPISLNMQINIQPISLNLLNNIKEVVIISLYLYFL
ncbi:hypothetical protein KUTeg_021879 [Tegillarca granosa]|uniref:Actin-related protein 5 n=1 Tax=Tegillarca granosa TaxID=220873 RepID=A0ABQ9EA64_TEGGR|nr:hypothetical protein KUTeg_021879 [Tegillarca granosa]